MRIGDTYSRRLQTRGRRKKRIADFHDNVGSRSPERVIVYVHVYVYIYLFLITHTYTVVQSLR